MTVDVRPKSAGETLEEISSRLYKVEQRSAATTGAVLHDDNPSVTTITVNGIVVGTAASPATDLTLASAAFMEDIWIDASWTAPADGTAANYDIELARKVGGVYQLVQNYRVGTATSIRMAALEPSQAYGVRVTAINRIGVRSIPLPSAGFMDITTGIDATVPGQVGGVVVTAGLKTVMVTWDEVADRDVSRGTGQYEVQLDIANDFLVPMSEFTSATIISFSNLTSNQIYYGRVRAIDNSGNAGAWSAIASGTTGRVQTVDLADTAVITSKLANGAVDTSKLGALAVTAANLADSSVISAKVDAAAITTAKLANGAVDNSKLGALAVDAAKLADSAVTSTKIANLAVGTAAIQAAAIGSAQIADAAIVSAKIGDAQIIEAKIANLAVNSAAIQALAVGTAHIADASILTAKIGDAQINTAKIVDLAVTNGKIANLAVDDAKIASLSADKITVGTLSADRIAANSLDVNKLTTSTLTSKTITIGSGGVLKIGNAPTTGILINDQGIRLYSGGTAKVVLDVAGTATFEGNISASTITSSTFTSVTINSGTITGTVIKTAATGARIELNQTSYGAAIAIFTAVAEETYPGVLGQGNGTGFSRLALTAPKRTLQTAPPYLYLDSVDSGPNKTFLASQQILISHQTVTTSWVQMDSNGKWTLNSPVTEALTLTCPTNGSTGLMIYGPVSPPGGSVTGALWKVHGPGGSNLEAMNITNSGWVGINASAFNVVSRQNTKENITPNNDSALEKLRKVRTVKYTHPTPTLFEPPAEQNPESGEPAKPAKPIPGRHPNRHIRRNEDVTKVGVIVEELFEVIPEAVTVDSEGLPLSYDITQIMAYLWQAVKELDTEVTRLKA